MWLDLVCAQLPDFCITMGGGLSKEVLESKHVCIIGGGYAGMACAVRLKEIGIPFTLIDKKDFFYHCVGVLRGMVEPGTLYSYFSHPVWTGVQWETCRM